MSTLQDSFAETIRPLALKLTELQDAEYDLEVRDWYENGDGRSSEWVEQDVTYEMPDGDVEHSTRTVNVGGRGYRFPHCRHGMSLTTDYDNICGGCESSMNNSDIAESLAVETAALIISRLDWVRAAPKNHGLPGDLTYDQMYEWAMRPLTEIEERISSLTERCAELRAGLEED